MEATKTNQCVICGYCDPENQFHDRLYTGMVFNGNSNPVRMGLCHKHSIELFKSGQTHFMTKYYEFAKQFIEHHNKSAYKVMKDIAMAESKRERVA